MQAWASSPCGSWRNHVRPAVVWGLVSWISIAPLVGTLSERSTAEFQSGFQFQVYIKHVPVDAVQVPALRQDRNTLF